MCKSQRKEITTHFDNTQSYSINTWSKDDETAEKEEKDFRFLALKSLTEEDECTIEINKRSRQESKAENYWLFIYLGQEF